MIADSVRIFVIWAVCLIVGWERFQWIQPIGFTVLLLGFFVFNGILSVPGQCMTKFGYFTYYAGLRFNNRVNEER